MKVAFIIISLIGFANGIYQEFDWAKTANWKIYDPQGHKTLGLSVDTIARFHSKLMGDKMVLDFLMASKELPNTYSTTWMGNFVCTYELNGFLRKVDISMYGGFFYDEYLKKYFEIPMDLRGSWYDMLNKQSRMLLQ